MATEDKQPPAGRIISLAQWRRDHAERAVFVGWDCAGGPEKTVRWELVWFWGWPLWWPVSANKGDDA